MIADLVCSALAGTLILFLLLAFAAIDRARGRQWW